MTDQDKDQGLNKVIIPIIKRVLPSVDFLKSEKELVWEEVCKIEQEKIDKAKKTGHKN